MFCSTGGTVTDAAEEAKVTEVIAYQYLSDICSWRLLTLDSPLMVGGPGVVVQIHESQFTHKLKVWHILVYVLNHIADCLPTVTAPQGTATK